VNKSNTFITKEEFDTRVKAGEKLVLLDDMVVDLT